MREKDSFLSMVDTLTYNYTLSDLEKLGVDIEMMRELGYCSGIENYSRYFDGRTEGSRPFCLLDYFPKDFITVVDESHVALPQVRAMYGGDQSRKKNLVEIILLKASDCRLCTIISCKLFGSLRNAPTQSSGFFAKCCRMSRSNPRCFGIISRHFSTSAESLQVCLNC